MDSTIYNSGIGNWAWREEQGSHEAAVGWLFGGAERVVDIRELNGGILQPVRKCLVENGPAAVS